MNVFKGSRRLLLWTHSLLVGGLALYVYSNNPYVSAMFKTSGPDRVFVRTFDAGDCESPNASQTRHSVRLEGTGTINTRLCFTAREVNGKRLVPYEANGNVRGVDDWFSKNVSSYGLRRSEAFTVPSEDVAALRSAWWKAYWLEAWEALLWCLAVIGAIELFRRVVGWIMRGFLAFRSLLERKPPAANAA